VCVYGTQDESDEDAEEDDEKVADEEDEDEDEVGRRGSVPSCVYARARACVALRLWLGQAGLRAQWRVSVYGRLRVGVTGVTLCVSIASTSNTAEQPYSYNGHAFIHTAIQPAPCCVSSVRVLRAALRTAPPQCRFVCVCMREHACRVSGCVQDEYVDSEEEAGSDDSDEGGEEEDGDEEEEGGGARGAKATQVRARGKGVVGCGKSVGLGPG
jgi:hypothetical protein